MSEYKFLKSKKTLGKISVISRLSMIAVLVIFLTGCDGNQSTSSLADINTKGEIQALNSSVGKMFEEADAELVKLVRRSTARYNSTNQAIRAGYLGDEHCAAHPELGGMGYHWVNMDLIDPVFDPANPEALLYEPDNNGNLKLVGVEYIVIDVGQERPHFGDYPFDIEGVPPLMAQGVPHWSLHVWLYKENPNGIFTPFNPNVSC